jgi:hypothetical protein
MSGLLVLLFFIVPVLDIACWVAWKNAQKENKSFFFFLLLVLSVPQALFLIYVVSNIAIALFTGKRL